MGYFPVKRKPLDVPHYSPLLLKSERWVSAATRAQRLVKRHRSYTVEEAATLLQVHRNTVRQWIKHGLAVIDDRKPALILGPELAEFLKARRNRNKCSCGPGEIYCLRCRRPAKPAGDMLDYVPTTSTLGCLVGLCATCGSVMYRRTSVALLEGACGGLAVRILKSAPHIVDGTGALVNSDLR